MGGRVAAMILSMVVLVLVFGLRIAGPLCGARLAAMIIVKLLFVIWIDICIPRCPY